MEDLRATFEEELERLSGVGRESQANIIPGGWAAICKDKMQMKS